MDIFKEVIDIDRLKPKGVTLDYLDEVDESVKEIDSQRPLAADITQKLQEEILFDRVHASAVIEGNSLSRRETIVVLSSGVLEAGSRKDQQEVINLADACVYLQDCLDNNVELSVHLIKELHQKLLTDIDNQNAGRFRGEDVAISGAKLSPPSHLDVQALVQSIVDAERQENIHPIQKAAWIHWAFARVHPFIDGNGRMARLLQDFVLLKNRYVPASVQPEDREKNYYEALEQTDLGSGEELLEVIAKNVLRMSQRYLVIIRNEKSRTSWVKGIAKAASEKVRQTEHREFLVSQKSFDLLKLEFSNLCAELNIELSDMYVGFKDYGSIDFEKYQELKNKGRANQTWFFGLRFAYGEIDQRFIFWFGKHYSSSNDYKNFDHNEVCLLISMQDGAGSNKKLDDYESEDRITLRELILQGRDFSRRRYNPVTKKAEWDSQVTPTDIAQTFITEVLAKMGLV
ncbi:Fic family protein [Methylomonas methanica]|uniref:Filamentation induced by cAMP protein Fic n=1 Tax=Methylomonas methanica (strain DSM 25384 / MC09) TaxID=857087 RepID=F9ZWM5_METMM|nr:Fic family protein [Methylomonas methanica]AEG00872.1 filamentation induced by cAMP protein Fic [Methylomonas methanica MC09]